GSVVAAAGEVVVGSTVTLFDTYKGVTTAVGTAIVQADGTFTANNVALLGGGAHSIVAVDTDLGGFVGSSTPVVLTLAVAPVVTAGGSATFTGGGAAVTLDGQLTVSDVDSPTLAGATVTISTGFLAGDTLNFTSQNGITGTYANGTLTLSGTATVAQYQA